MAEIRETNREQILEAAEICFARNGYSGTTTSAIARQADLPKANIHYYFQTKENLYGAVLSNILDLWLDSADVIHEGADPAQALTKYIRAKVQYSRLRPNASKMFAGELLHGAPHLKNAFFAQIRDRVRKKAAVFEKWAQEGRMAPIPAEHLFFMIWATTQTYADFDCQVTAVLDKPRLEERDYEDATRFITEMVLKGCGISPKNKARPVADSGHTQAAGRTAKT